MAIASKNNLSDVKKVFRKNKNMVLKEDDITIFKVNWNDKAANILEISKDLMLGLDKKFVRQIKTEGFSSVNLLISNKDQFKKLVELFDSSGMPSD